MPEDIAFLSLDLEAQHMARQDSPPLAGMNTDYELIGYLRSLGTADAFLGGKGGLPGVVGHAFDPPWAGRRPALLWPKQSGKEQGQDGGIAAALPKGARIRRTWRSASSCLRG